MRDLIAKISRRLFPPAEILEGYENPELIAVMYRKTLVYQPDISERLDIGTATSVLDFGGSFGIHYKQANSLTARWAVVEIPAMVDQARALETDKLRFFTKTSEAAAWLGPIDLMHSFGALQYTPDPIETLKELCGLGAKRMLWQCLRFSRDNVEHETQTSFLSDNGPGRLVIKEKRVEYIRTRIPEREFLLAHSRYEVAARGADWFDFRLTKSEQ